MDSIHKKVTFVTTIVSILLLNLCAIKEAKAAIREITNFTEIDDAVFIDLPSGNILNPVNFDSGIITGSSAYTPQPNFIDGSFAGFAEGGLNDPGSGDGYFAYNNDTIYGSDISPVILDFSSPLAAFGVTFYHFSPDRDGQTNFPATLQVFDGLNGSGNLLASVVSSGFQDQDGGNPDFIAVWSDTLNIRSAVLSGTGSNKGFGVDGYGVSLTPLTPLTSVPEPATLLGLGMVSGGLFVTRRSWRSGARGETKG